MPTAADLLVALFAPLASRASAQLVEEPARELASELIALVRCQDRDIVSRGGPPHRLLTRGEKMNVLAERHPDCFDGRQLRVAVHNRDGDHGLGWVHLHDSIRAHREPRELGSEATSTRSSRFARAAPGG